MSPLPKISISPSHKSSKFNFNLNEQENLGSNKNLDNNEILIKESSNFSITSPSIIKRSPRKLRSDLIDS